MLNKEKYADILVGIIQYGISAINLMIYIERGTLGDGLAGLSWFLTGTIWLMRSENLFPK